MKHRFKNSKYFYEADGESITIKKIFLTKTNAITAIVILSFIIPLTIYMLIAPAGPFQEDLFAFIYFSFITLVLLCCFAYSVTALIWQPTIAVFYDDCLIRKNLVIPYTDITKVYIESFKSAHALRAGYQVDHLCLNIELNDSRLIKLIEITDRKHSDELDSFKILVEQLVLKN